MLQETNFINIITLKKWKSGVNQKRFMDGVINFYQNFIKYKKEIFNLNLYIKLINYILFIYNVKKKYCILWG